jgi:hypothetical protein
MRLSLRQARARPARTPGIRTFSHQVRPPERLGPDQPTTPELQTL